MENSIYSNENLIDENFTGFDPKFVSADLIHLGN